jgi:hypothetical protein
MLKRELVLPISLVCLAAAGCGQSGRGVPPAAPPVVPPAFVFAFTPRDKQPALLSVLQVDPNGDLRLTSQLAIEDAIAMTADPKGRFVFVGGGKPTDCGPDHSMSECHGFPGYLRTYAVDATSGALSQRSEHTMGSRPNPAGGSNTIFDHVQKLAASDDTVYATLQNLLGADFIQLHLDAASGALSDGPGVACDLDDWPSWMIPTGPRLLLGGDNFLECVPRDAVNKGDVFGVYAPEPDDGGRLHRHAVAPLAETSWAYASTGALAGNCVVAGWSANGLPDANGKYDNPVHGLTAFAIDAGSGVPSERNTVSDTEPVALAGATGVVAVAITTEKDSQYKPVAGELDLHTLTPACDLAPTSTGIVGLVTSLAFHPDGYFLYAMQPDGIHTYAQRSDGRWEPRSVLAGVTGALVAARVTP